jgi:hypothetical protein
MADTASLVVALSAQLTKFEKDMRAAGIMADKAASDIENKFSKMNPQISTSFFGNLFSNIASKGLSAIEDAVKDIIKRFEELQQTAKNTETSLQWVYGLQQAFKKDGASADDLNRSLTSIALQLDQMQRGNTENALAKLFAANPQAMKGFALDTASAAEALAKVGDIVQTLKPIERIEVARALGLPESSVQALERGGAALNKIADDAARSAPDLQRAAEATKALSDAWSTFTKTLSEGWSETLLAGLRPLVGIALAIQEAEAKLFKGGPLESIADRELVKWQKISDTVNKVNKDTAAPTERIRVTPANQFTGKDPFGLNAPAAAGAFDRETNSINKHIAAMQANAATTGESAGAQEEYRVQMILSEKAIEQYGDLTDAVNDKIAVQAARAGQAAQALAQNQFQLQKINAASQQFGQALSTSFTDAIVEGKRLNEVAADLIKTFEKAALNSLIMSFFTPGAGQSTSLFSNLFKFAEGTNSAPGGLALVGEKGPELVNLPRGSQVIPNNVTRSMMGSGGAVVYSPSIDARGASVEAVARLAQILEQDRATFAARTVATIQQARRGRVAGL